MKAVVKIKDQPELTVSGVKSFTDKENHVVLYFENGNISIIPYCNLLYVDVIKNSD